MTAKKETPPWRSGQYTPILNQVAIALARSNLTRRACGVFLVIATETWGHPGKWRQYGRPSAPVGAAYIAEQMHANEKTARRGLRELEEKGWVRCVAPCRGSRAATWEPTLTPPAPCPAMPEDEAPIEPPPDAPRGEWLKKKLAERQSEILRRAMGEHR